jgi:hypothetical protein
VSLNKILNNNGIFENMSENSSSEKKVDSLSSLNSKSAKNNLRNSNKN